MIYDDDQIAHSLVAAALLLLSGFDPIDDITEYVALPKVDVNGRTRKGVTIGGVSYGSTYGPDGVWLLPGVVCEYGESEEPTEGNRIVPLTLSVSRNIVKSVEIDQTILSELCRPLKALVFARVKQQCPIYSFAFSGADDSEMITAVIGNLRWHSATMRLPAPREATIGNRTVGGFLRREYEFSVRYTNH